MRINDMDTKEMLELLIRKAKYATKKVIIIFLANVKDVTTNNFDYTDSSILTEFLSMEEYNELLTSLQDFGFFVLTYFNSIDFIKDYINEKFNNSKVVIFEGTQKGIGRARDAYIPAFCDLEGLLHTGPNAYVNSICTNKYHWTKLLSSNYISVPNSWQYYKGGWLNNEKPCLDKVLIAKPCYECASIGIHKQSVALYSTKYETYLKKISNIYNQPLIVQEFIPGYEIEVPVIIHQNQPYILPPIAICKENNLMMGNEFLDFDLVYDDNYQFSLLESFNQTLCLQIQEQVTQIIKVLDLECYTRIDFRVDSYGKSYVTDINSYPHIVNHSSFAYAFEQLHMDKRNLLPALIGNVLTDIN